MPIKFSDKYLTDYISAADCAAVSGEVASAAKTLLSGGGAGSEFLGWRNLPNRPDADELRRIALAAEKIRKNTDVFIVIGIGGSYLGARAAIEFVQGGRRNKTKKNGPLIYYAGCDLCPSTIAELLQIADTGEVSINVISKSGTTTEPAVAFRIFREYLEKRYGRAGAAERIFVTTDKSRGKLKELSDAADYETFVVPDDVGGRFSVLTAVGLLPIAVAGIDIYEMLDGAKRAKNTLEPDLDPSTNDALRYVAARNILYRRGKSVEIMAAYDSALCMTAEWWKQLFGESEGKDGKGIFPASVSFTTDLHSLGQFIQDGSRIMFETVLDLLTPKDTVVVPHDPANSDGLNFIAGKELHYVNRVACEATSLAHRDGGVPILTLSLDSRSAADFGYLVYFFEYAVAVSGYLLGVNPFDQPGVESYKKNMFRLLGKE